LVVLSLAVVILAAGDTAVLTVRGGATAAAAAAESPFLLPASGEKTEFGREIPEARSESSRTYVSGNGRWTTIVSAAPVNYQDANLV
jgi:hypothetical protein